MDNGASSYRRFLNGDQSAFDEIMQELFHSLVFFINRYVQDIHTAEDLAIDTFSDLIVHRHRYNFKVTLKTYLFMVGRSRALDYLRHRKVLNFVELSEADTLASDTQSLEERMLDVGVRPLPDGYGQSPDGDDTNVSTDKISDADILNHMESFDFEVQYIRTNGFPEYVKYPVVEIIRSVDELNAYYERNKDIYYLERRENPASDDTIGFLDACDKYDAKYFENQTLIMVLLVEPSGSIRHKVEQVGIYGEDEKNVIIDIDTLRPEVETADMALWHILIEPEAGVAVGDEDNIKVFRGRKNVSVSYQPTVVSYGKDYANITLNIPKGWEYEIEDLEQEKGFYQEFGICFWPKDAPEGKMQVSYYGKNRFEVCGTGLTVKTVEIGKHKAKQGMYDEKPVWDYIYFQDTPPGAYVAQNEWSHELWIESGHKLMRTWWDTYGEEVMEILTTVKFGEGILTEEQAIETAKLKCNIEYDQIKAEFSYEDATWTVSFFKKTDENGDAIVGGDLQVVMDASGNIIDLIYGE